MFKTSWGQTSQAQGCTDIARLLSAGSVNWNSGRSEVAEGSESAAKLPFKPGQTAVSHRPETAVRFRSLPVSA